MRCNNNILKFLSILLVLSINTDLLCNTAYAVNKAYKVETLFNIGTKFDDNVAQVNDILYYHDGRSIYKLNMITKESSVYVEDLLSKSVTLRRNSR